jgi:hypothetical protein
VIPVGTEKVPEDVNDSIPLGVSVIEKERDAVFEALSNALITKFVVVVPVISVVSVPVICPLLEFNDNPAGKLPD